MSKQNNYRCAHEHKGHKRGDIISAELYAKVEQPEYWVPVASDDALKNLKQAREKMVNDKTLIKK